MEHDRNQLHLMKEVLECPDRDLCNSTGVVKADPPITPYHPVSSEPVTKGRKISISVSDHERYKFTKFEIVFNSKLRSPLPSKFLAKYSELQFSGVKH
jgi:hypothetical protein